MATSTSYAQRALFAMTLFSLNKAVLGEREMKVYNDDIKTVHEEHPGTMVGVGMPVAVVIVAMLFGMFLSYVYVAYTNKLQRLAFHGKVAEHQKEAQRWQDKCSAENDELAKRLQEIIDLQMAHRKEKREW